MTARLRTALVTAALAAAPVAAGPPDVLTGPGTASLTLTAPLADLRRLASSEDDASVQGSLTLDDGSHGTPYTVRVSERGHTSRNPGECAFPKLRLEFVSADRTGGPFDSVDVLKIGTHCGDAAPDTLTPKYGRLANELAPRREAMVYSLLAAAGVPTLLARPARITYAGRGASAQPTLTRYALLLEDDDAAAARLGAAEMLTEDTFDSAAHRFSPPDTARLALAEAMIGNFDWCLRMFPGDIYRCDDRHPLWNILGLSGIGSRALPLPYDFDLSGPVVGRHVWFDQVFDRTFVDPPSAVRVEVLAQVQRTRTLFTRAVLDDARASFVSARTAIEVAITNADVDERGRDLARQYVGAFFEVITDDARFYQPVLVEGGHVAWLDPDGQTFACGADSSTVPEGTPVAPLGPERNGRSQVRLLDALWKWTGNNRCDTVHRQPIWIDSRALGTEYPR